jgi:hypothetical protein
MFSTIPPMHYLLAAHHLRVKLPRLGDNFILDIIRQTICQEKKARPSAVTGVPLHREADWQNDLLQSICQGDSQASRLGCIDQLLLGSRGRRRSRIARRGDIRIRIGADVSSCISRASARVNVRIGIAANIRPAAVAAIRGATIGLRRRDLGVSPRSASRIQISTRTPVADSGIDTGSRANAVGTDAHARPGAVTWRGVTCCTVPWRNVAAAISAVAAWVGAVAAGIPTSVTIAAIAILTAAVGVPAAIAGTTTAAATTAPASITPAAAVAPAAMPMPPIDICDDCQTKDADNAERQNANPSLCHWSLLGRRFDAP